MLLKRLARKIRGKKTDAGASAADGGRLRFDYLVDDVNKPNMIKNQLPRSRWSNRAFPPNHADLDPHPHPEQCTDIRSKKGAPIGVFQFGENEVPPKWQLTNWPIMRWVPAGR